MQITKSQVIKQAKIDSGEESEVVDVKLQVLLEKGDTYELMRTMLHTAIDKRLTQLFKFEADVTPPRIEETRAAMQLDLFSYRPALWPPSTQEDALAPDPAPLPVNETDDEDEAGEGNPPVLEAVGAAIAGMEGVESVQIRRAK